MIIFVTMKEWSLYEMDELMRYLWDSSKVEGKHSILTWMIFPIMIPMAFFYGIDVLLTGPMKIFFYLCEKFEKTVTEDNLKGDRRLVPPIMLFLALTGPTIIWAIPRIISNHRDVGNIVGL